MCVCFARHQLPVGEEGSVGEASCTPRSTPRSSAEFEPAVLRMPFRPCPQPATLAVASDQLARLKPMQGCALQHTRWDSGRASHDSAMSLDTCDVPASLVHAGCRPHGMSLHISNSLSSDGSDGSFYDSDAQSPLHRGTPGAAHFCRNSWPLGRSPTAAPPRATPGDKRLDADCCGDSGAVCVRGGCPAQGTGERS